jgi:hypothetical protein
MNKESLPPKWKLLCPNNSLDQRKQAIALMKRKQGHVHVKGRICYPQKPLSVNKVKKLHC